MVANNRSYVVEIPVKRGKVLFQTKDNHVEIIVMDETGNTASADLDSIDRKAILDFLPQLRNR